MTDSPLSQLSRKDLEFLRKQLQRGQLEAPIGELALQAMGKGRLFARLGPLVDAGPKAALALLDAALATDSQSAARPTNTRTPAALTWTGPTVTESHVRRTSAVLLERLAAARSQVWIVGYEFDYGAVLFDGLHEAMAEHGVRVKLCLDLRPAPTPKTQIESHLAARAHLFARQNWPFGAPYPEVFYWPAGVAHGANQSLHAKCVAIDDTWLIAGSANFTRRGHNRNLEIGVCLHDPERATALGHILENLVATGELAPLSVSSVPRSGPPPAIEAEEDDDEPATVQGGQGRPGADTHVEFLEESGVPEALWPLLQGLLEDGYTPPEVGEDLTDATGRVVGTAELSWSEERVAILLPEQLGARAAIEASGFRCLTDDEAIADPAKVRQTLVFTREGA